MDEVNVKSGYSEPVILPLELADRLRAWVADFTSVCHCAPVVTLCGSSKFKSEFEAVSLDLSLMGIIVISLGLFGHADHPEIMVNDCIKSMLDRNHKQKIRMSNAIFVVDPGNYIGSSTRSEIDYAKEIGRRIWYLE